MFCTRKNAIKIYVYNLLFNHRYPPKIDLNVQKTLLPGKAPLLSMDLFRMPVITFTITRCASSHSLVAQHCDKN